AAEISLPKSRVARERMYTRCTFLASNAAPPPLGEGRVGARVAPSSWSAGPHPGLPPEGEGVDRQASGLRSSVGVVTAAPAARLQLEMAFMRMRSPSSAPPLLRRDGSIEITATRSLSS